MTPEFPRAPISEPCVMACAMSDIEALSGRDSISCTTVANVSDMFVPVSPSGTGNTLSLFISSAFSETTLAATGKHLRIALDIMKLRPLRILWTYRCAAGRLVLAQALHVDANLRLGYLRNLVENELHRAHKILRHG